MSTRLLLVHESPKVISLILNRNSTRLGRVRFTPPTLTTNTDDTIAYLHHIKVNHFYRNKEIGSFMLNHMNTYLKKNTLAETIKSVLWDDMSNPYLSSFFIKNGYTLNTGEQTIYDDGEKIFEITPIERNL